MMDNWGPKNCLRSFGWVKIPKRDGENHRQKGKLKYESETA